MERGGEERADRLPGDHTRDPGVRVAGGRGGANGPAADLLCPNGGGSRSGEFARGPVEQNGWGRGRPRVPGPGRLPGGLVLGQGRVNVARLIDRVCMVDARSHLPPVTWLFRDVQNASELLTTCACDHVFWTTGGRSSRRRGGAPG